MKIITQKWDIGAHSGFSDRITPTIQESISSGMYTTQFFMGNPKSYKRQQITKDDIQKTKKLLYRFPMNVFTHFPYIANLNGSVKELAWQGGSIDSKLSYVLEQLEYELNIIANFSDHGKCGVVIHPGCYPDRELGLKTIAHSINQINFTPGSKLLLENCAGEGRKLCRDFKEIALVFDNLDKKKAENVGVCVDTAHIWGQGDYDISTIDGVNKMLMDLDKYIGFDKFCLLHLNDSEVPFGSKKDRHACIGTGYIWGKDFKSLVYLLDRCKELNVPIVLETQETDMITLANLGNLIISP